MGDLLGGRPRGRLPKPRRPAGTVSMCPRSSASACTVKDPCAGGVGGSARARRAKERNWELEQAQREVGQSRPRPSSPRRSSWRCCGEKPAGPERCCAREGPRAGQRADRRSGRRLRCAPVLPTAGRARFWACPMTGRTAGGDACATPARWGTVVVRAASRCTRSDPQRSRRCLRHLRTVGHRMDRSSIESSRTGAPHEGSGVGVCVDAAPRPGSSGP